MTCLRSNPERRATSVNVSAPSRSKILGMEVGAVVRRSSMADDVGDRRRDVDAERGSDLARRITLAGWLDDLGR